MNEERMMKQHEQLRKYNRWRRGDKRLKQPDPKELGELIDSVADRLEGLERECKNKDCAYWRDTPLGDSHHKCITCCRSAWLPKSDKDNYKPNQEVNGE